DYLDRTDHAGWQRTITAWFIGAIVCPFAEFFQRYGKAALLILAFVATFRISDIFMGVMANPFYLDLGFSKAQIANIAAAFGLAMTLLGAALGGLLVARFGIAPILLLTAFMAPATNLMFAWLAYTGPQTQGLVMAIIADNITGGLAISVFIAYLSSLTNTAYTATQYALFSSLMTLPGQFAAGFTGVMAAAMGWVPFFMVTALTGLPAIVLAALLIRHAHPDRVQRPGVDRAAGAAGPGQRSVAEAGGLQRHVELGTAQESHGFLQVIALLAGNAHLRALDGGLDLALGALDGGDNLLRQRLIDAFAPHHFLLHVLARGIGILHLQALHIDFALGQTQAQDLQHLLQLELGLGSDGHCKLLVVELETALALEIVSAIQLLHGIIDSIGDFVFVQLGHDIKGRHDGTSNKHDFMTVMAE